MNETNINALHFQAVQLNWTVDKSQALPAAILLAVLLCCLLIAYYRMHKQMQQMINIDPLTGLWKMKRFLTEMNRILQTDRHKKHVVVYIGIEGFFYINDVYGREQGEHVLVTLSDILRMMIYPGEILARANEDSAVILMEYDSEERINDRIGLLLEKMSMIPKGECDYYYLVFSVGICPVHDNDRDADYLIHCADDAHRSLQGTRCSRYAWFNDEFQKEQREDHEIELRMQEALYEEQFVPYFQPKYDLKTLELVGAEALVRWLDPIRGLLPPDRFVPLFEKNGFIIQIDFYIFEQVCRLQRQLIDEGRKPVVISSNFSAIHFRRPNFIELLGGIMEQYQIPSGLLELEITESAVVEDIPRMVALLEEVRELGILIAMDDFGAGYSSLNMLEELPIDILKIDREFLRKGLLSERGRVIIGSFVDLAHRLGTKVVCEGVEIQEQADFLREVDCEIAQGYLYAKPMPLETFQIRLFLEAETCSESAEFSLQY